MIKRLFYILTLSLMMIILCSCELGNVSSNYDESKMKVTLVHNNGTKNSILYLDKGMIITTLQEPMKEDHLFLGWYHKDEKWNIQESPVIEDMTLSAKFTKIYKDDLFSYILNEDNKSYCIIEIKSNSEEITIPDYYNKRPITKIKLIKGTSCKTIRLSDNISEIDQTSYKYLIGKLIINSTNPYFEIIDSCLYSKDKTIFFSYMNTSDENVEFTVPNTVKIISSYAFSMTNHKIINIILPDSLTTINSFAFTGTYIGSINIPKNLEFMDGSAFYDTYITEMNVDENNEHYKSIDGVIYSKDEAVLIKLPFSTDYVDFSIPLTVKEIGPYALSDMLINQLHISKNVEKIHYTAFLNTPVKSITVDKENPFFDSTYNDLYTKDQKTLLKMSRNHAKEENKNKILEGVTIIANYALDLGVTETLQLPESLNIIGDSNYVSRKNASYIPYDLTITLPKNIMIIGDFAFYSIRCIPCIKTQDELTNMPDELISIGDFAFANIHHFQHGASVTSSVIFSEKSRLTLLGSNAFASHAILYQVVLPKSLKYIPDYLFSYCVDLENVTIPSEVIYISPSAFNETKYKQ